ncbi:hypothetical protein D5R81_11295 [Parashewanella spongiae]|uniref:Uncharacterized protein n=1 Tax=Parashewanella spongiae TaxID=342950 RepID=A0A3A6TVS5_9GAMM|nr:hypothetical protein [Parashewanella spongiae]MCL1078547.1 hypothetical protein [Parashewanella spongiae]RJY13319.1 hypothetical protein D5R81_11295 [Parashewanella spongiae]
MSVELHTLARDLFTFPDNQSHDSYEIDQAFESFEANHTSQSISQSNFFKERQVVPVNPRLFNQWRALAAEHNFEFVSAASRTPEVNEKWLNHSLLDPQTKQQKREHILQLFEIGDLFCRGINVDSPTIGCAGLELEYQSQKVEPRPGTILKRGMRVELFYLELHLGLYPVKALYCYKKDTSTTSNTSLTAHFRQLHPNRHCLFEKISESDNRLDSLYRSRTSGHFKEDGTHMSGHNKPEEQIYSQKTNETIIEGYRVEQYQCVIIPFPCSLNQLSKKLQLKTKLEKELNIDELPVVFYSCQSGEIKEIVFLSDLGLTHDNINELNFGIKKMRVFAEKTASTNIESLLCHLPPSQLLDLLQHPPSELSEAIRVLSTPYRNAILSAVREGNLTKFELCCENGANLNTTYYTHCAGVMGYFNLFQILVHEQYKDAAERQHELHQIGIRLYQQGCEVKIDQKLLKQTPILWLYMVQHQEPINLEKMPYKQTEEWQDLLSTAINHFQKNIFDQEQLQQAALAIKNTLHLQPTELRVFFTDTIKEKLDISEMNDFNVNKLEAHPIIQLIKALLPFGFRVDTQELRTQLEQENTSLLHDEQYNHDHDIAIVNNEFKLELDVEEATSVPDTPLLPPIIASTKQTRIYYQDFEIITGCEINPFAPPEARLNQGKVSAWLMVFRQWLSKRSTRIHKTITPNFVPLTPMNENCLLVSKNKPESFNEDFDEIKSEAFETEHAVTTKDKINSKGNVYYFTHEFGRQLRVGRNMSDQVAKHLYNERKQEALTLLDQYYTKKLNTIHDQKSAKIAYIECIDTMQQNKPVIDMPVKTESLPQTVKKPIKVQNSAHFNWLRKRYDKSPITRNKSYLALAQTAVHHYYCSPQEKQLEVLVSSVKPVPVMFKKNHGAEHVTRTQIIAEALIELFILYQPTTAELFIEEPELKELIPLAMIYHDVAAEVTDKSEEEIQAAAIFQRDMKMAARYSSAITQLVATALKNKESDLSDCTLPQLYPDTSPECTPEERTVRQIIRLADRIDVIRLNHISKQWKTDKGLQKWTYFQSELLDLPEAMEQDSVFKATFMSLMEGAKDLAYVTGGMPKSDKSHTGSYIERYKLDVSNEKRKLKITRATSAYDCTMQALDDNVRRAIAKQAELMTCTEDHSKEALKQTNGRAACLRTKDGKEYLSSIHNEIELRQIRVPTKMTVLEKLTFEHGDITTLEPQLKIEIEEEIRRLKQNGILPLTGTLTQHLLCSPTVTKKLEDDYGLVVKPEQRFHGYDAQNNPQFVTVYHPEKKLYG